MDMGATIGQRIVFFRNLIGWNQNRLILETGIKQSRMSKIESGASKPYFHEVQLIALVLGQPLDHFDTKRNRGFTITVVPKDVAPTANEPRELKA